MKSERLRAPDTKTRLLDAALAVHARSGPAGFTVHAVIAESGISLGSLYHHFKSFDGLAAALYARCMGELLDALVRDVERTTSARAGIVALTRAYLEFTGDRPEVARFVHASSYATFLPAHAAAITEAKAPRLARLFAWARPHVAAGKLVALPEPLFEMMLIGPVAETARRWLAGAPGIDLALAAELLPERVWQSVRRAPRQAARAIDDDD